MWLLFKDAWYTQSWKDKFRVWYKPTGWRPSDMAEKYPVYKIEDVYDFEKYDTGFSKLFLAWTWIQMILLLLFVSYLFGNIALVGNPGIFIYGAFVFLFVYAITELMDKNAHAFIWEFIKCSAGIGIILYFGDWFNIAAYAPWLKYVLIAYFVLSSIITTWFNFNFRSEENSLFGLN